MIDDLRHLPRAENDSFQLLHPGDAFVALMCLLTFAVVFKDWL